MWILHLRVHSPDDPRAILMLVWCWITRSSGNPKRKVWCNLAASFPSVWNQGYRTSRSRNSSEGCWRRRYSITNVEPAHNTIKLLFPNETVRLSISPACWKQRIKRLVRKMSIKLQRMKKGTVCSLWFNQFKRIDRGPQFTSGVSP